MKKIDWARKLTSRKFWIAIAAFVTSLIVAFGGGEDVATTVSGVIMSGATAIAYIIGEGLTDAAHSSNGEIPDKTEDGGDENGENI